MKKLFILILMSCSTSDLFCQQVGVDTTILSGNDQGIFYDRTILINSQNEKFVFSTFKGVYVHDTFSLSSALPNSTYPLNRSLFVEKYDSNNHFLWARKIAESDSLNFFNVTLDRYDNILLSITYRSILFLENSQIQPQGGNDFIILKFDSNLNLTFNKHVASIYHDQVQAISSDSFGNTYFAGLAGYSDDTSYKSNVYFDAYLSPPIWQFIAKMDSAGNYVWIKNSGARFLDNLVCNGTSLFCCGGILMIDTIMGVPIIVQGSYTDVFFLGKIDSSGQGQWARYFGNATINGGSFNEIFIASRKNRVSVTSNAYAQITNDNIFKFENGPTLLGRGDGIDCMIYTLDTSGNFIWNTVSNSEGAEYYDALAYDDQNNLYTCGKYNYYAIIGTDPSPGLGGDDFVIVKYDSLGNYKWHCRNGGYYGDIARDMKLDSYQRPYFVGATTSPFIWMGNDSIVISNTNSHLLFARIDSISYPLQNTSLEFDGLKLFPNPASGSVNISYDSWNPVSDRIDLVNGLGEAIATYKPNLNQQVIQINLEHVQPGLYGLNCVRNGKIKFFKLIIK